ncbi:MAG: hypothetical protein R3F37_13260 [Candidatus Competibacteraceae bacterium]
MTESWFGVGRQDRRQRLTDHSNLLPSFLTTSFGLCHYQVENSGLGKGLADFSENAKLLNDFCKN